MVTRTNFSRLFALAAAASIFVGFCRGDETKNQGDVRSIRFTLPFDEALKRAKADQRLILLKPIYGGVDQLGERDYRCGSW